MAQFTKTHGDFQPVVVMDSPVAASSPGAGWSSGLNAITSGATVQPQGPKLEYCTITFTGTGTTGTQILNTINAIQQLATIYIYEFTTDTNDTLAVAFYPTGAWGPDITATGPGTLDAAVTAAAGEAVSVTASATFTN